MIFNGIRYWIGATGLATKRPRELTLFWVRRTYLLDQLNSLKGAFFSPRKVVKVESNELKNFFGRKLLLKGMKEDGSTLMASPRSAV